MVKKEANSKRFTKSHTFTSKDKKYKASYKEKSYKNIPTYSNSLSKEKKYDSWLDGTFAIDPLTWKTYHIPKKK